MEDTEMRKLLKDDEIRKIFDELNAVFQKHGITSTTIVVGLLELLKSAYVLSSNTKGIGKALEAQAKKDLEGK